MAFSLAIGTPNILNFFSAVFLGDRDGDSFLTFLVIGGKDFLETTLQTWQFIRSKKYH